MSLKDYKDLKVWNKGIELTDKIYLVTKSFPKDEIYGLTSQLKRAAVSVPSNIAEGYLRNHKKEYIQFLHISMGSCAELETLLTISKNQNFISTENFNILTDLINHEIRMLINLVKNL